MRFRLLFKQAVRDFKNKLQLYISFALFLIVCLSMIIGMLSFSHAYSSINKNVFDNHGRVANSSTTQIYFLDKNAPKHKGLYDLNKQNYLVDEGELEDFTYDQVLNKGIDNKPSDNKYTWGRSLTADEISTLKSMNEDNAYNVYNLISYIGSNKGSINKTAISNFTSIAGLSLGQDFTINKILDNLDIPDANTIKEKFKTENNQYNYAVEYFALVKLYAILNQPFPVNGESVDNYWFYDSSLLNKFLIEEKLDKLSGELTYGNAPGWLSDSFNYSSSKQNLRMIYSYMPGEDWMDKYSETKTPDQFKKNDLKDMYIEKRLSVNKIDQTRLKNMHYAYLDPAFMRANNYKLGDIFTWNDKNNTYDAQIIGTALSKNGYFNNWKRGFVYLPAQYLNEIQPFSSVPASKPSDSDENRIAQPTSKSNGYSGWISDNYSLYINKFGSDYIQANNYTKEHIYGNFVSGEKDSSGNWEQNTALGGKKFNYLSPNSNTVMTLANSSAFLFKLLTIAISGGVAILLIAVFWFISSETIKMQRKTLWFLKALGEKKYKLSLLTTLSVMVPFMVAALISIFGSIGVSAIMNSAVGYNYAFYLPLWSFDWYSLIVFLVIIIASFAIFMILNVILLSGKTLTLQGQTKVGFITLLYMKTKRIYNVFPASYRIGMSFVVQNIFKNILTFLLLLISFGVVLFAMQFNSSARSSAHSYENRNAPYQSIMLNKLNNTDAVSLNGNYLNQTFGITLQDIYKEIGEGNTNFILELLYGQGYSSDSIKSINDSEQSMADQINQKANNDYFKAVQNTDDLNKAIYSPVQNVDEMLKDQSVKFDLSNAFYNKYFSESFINNTLLNKDKSVYEIAQESLKVNPSDIDELLSDIKKANDDNVIFGFLVANGMSVQDAYKVKIWIAKMDDTQKAKIKQGILSTVNYMESTFANTLLNIRSLSSQVQDSLGLKKLDMSILFNRSIVPEDTDSYYATDLLYKGSSISGVGLDERDSETYKKIVSPYGTIKEIGRDNFDDSDNMSTVKYTVDSKNGIYKDIPVHVMHGYISGNMADAWHIKVGDTIQLGAVRNPGSLKDIHNIYMKVDKIVKESSIFQEIYFNKIDYFNYLEQSVLNNWDGKIADEQAKASAANPNKKNEAVSFYMPIPGVDTKLTPEQLDQKMQLDYLTHAIEKIENDKYAYNNSVFSLSKVPYSLEKWTMNAKVGSGFTFFSYLEIPIFNYVSQEYPQNYSDNIYIFSMVTEQLMNSVQPIISTVVRFIVLLLILVFVVAIILINLVLLENRQTILLFKAMGYQLKQISGFLLSGYIFADIFGLIVGIVISYFGIHLASAYTNTVMHISLFPVWSWQFITTAIVMALVFIGLIFGAVAWYTVKQKPRDAFNTL